MDSLCIPGVEVQRRLVDCLYGYIASGVDLDNDKPVAVKVFESRLTKGHASRSGATLVEDMDMELEVLQAATRVPHPNLMGLERPIPATKTPSQLVAAVLPWMDKGDYMELLMGGTRQSVPTVRAHFRAIASAIAHLHGLGYCHRDISLENIMLYSAGEDKLVPVVGDYGAAAALGSFKAPRIRPGKPGYTAPEIYRYQAYDGAAIDVYSLGVCLFCMLAMCMPYERPTRTDPCFAMIMRGGIQSLISAWNLDDRFAGGALELVCRMMDMDPSKRPSMHEVLAHRWCAATSVDMKLAEYGSSEFSSDEDA